MDCDFVRSWLSAKLDGEVPENICKSIDNHLADCPACLREWEILQKQEALLKKLSWNDPGQAFWDNYLLKHKEFVFQKRSKRIYFPVAAMAASLILALFLIISSSSQNRTDDKIENKNDSVSLAKSKEEKVFQDIFWEKRTMDAALKGNPKAIKEITAFFKLNSNRIPYKEIVTSVNSKESLGFAMNLFAEIKAPESYAAVEMLYRKGMDTESVLKTLKQINTGLTLKILVNELTNDKMKPCVLKILKEIGPLSGEYLSKRINETRDIPDVWIETLAFLNDAHSFNTLASLATNGKNRPKALEVLGNTGRDEAIAILLKSLRNYSLRESAITGLKNIKPKSTLLLLKMAHERDHSISEPAIEILGKLEDNSAVPDLIALAKQRNFKKSIIEALANLKDPSTASFFMDLAEHKEFRKEAYQALSNIKEPAVFSFLVEKLYHNESLDLALEALKNFRDPKLIPYILEVLPYSSDKAMEVLCFMPPKEVVPYFIDMLDSPRLRRLSYRALKKVTGEDFGANPYYWRKWFNQI